MDTTAKFQRPLAGEFAIDRLWSESDAEGGQLALIDVVSQTGEPIQRNQKVQRVEFPLHFLGQPQGHNWIDLAVHQAGLGKS